MLASEVDRECDTMKSEHTILVVDDDITLLKLAEELLCSSYSVSLAKSGAAALQLLEKGFLPDLVLLDVDMPGMDGYETIAQIRQLAALQDVPIIFLTGLCDSTAELRGLQAGACDYITKPFSKHILLARLALHLETGRQKRKLRALESGGATQRLDTAKFAEFSRNLTPTEQKVAMLIALGYTNREICEQLHYSYSYIKKVATVIFEKADVSKRHELRQLLT